MNVKRTTRTKTVAERLSGIAQRIRVDAVMTSRDELVVARPDASVGDARRLMGDSFDQLPVLDRSQWTGVVERRDLKGHHDTHPISKVVRPAKETTTVAHSAPMQNLMDLLSAQPYVVVVEPETKDRLVGLVHYSDLNKHALRSNAYLWLSKLEIQLARVVKFWCTDHEEWLGLLDDRRQVAVIGRYELARRRGMGLHAVEGTELSDLLKIVRLLPGLCEKLGMSKRQFENKTGPLIRIRNAVMHPVRSLIVEHEDVGKLAASADGLVEVLEAADRMLTEQRNAKTD